MIYLGLYLLAGVLALFLTMARGRAAKDDILLPFFVLAEPLGWIAWLLWPLTLPIYHIELRERARLRAHKDGTAETDEPQPVSLLGEQAIAATRMCPTGMLEIAGQHREAWSEDGFIEAGERVVVIAERDSRLVVRKLADQPMPPSEGSHSTQSPTTQFNHGWTRINTDSE